MITVKTTELISKHGRVRFQRINLIGGICNECEEAPSVYAYSGQYGSDVENCWLCDICAGDQLARFKMANNWKVTVLRDDNHIMGEKISTDNL